MKKDAKIPKWIIRNMPYDTRLKHYQKEKDELFLRVKDLPAEEVGQLHKELADKWMV